MFQLAVSWKVRSNHQGCYFGTGLPPMKYTMSTKTFAKLYSSKSLDKHNSNSSLDCVVSLFWGQSMVVVKEEWHSVSAFSHDPISSVQ